MISYTDRKGREHVLPLPGSVTTLDDAARRRATILEPAPYERRTVANKKWEQIFAEGCMACSRCREVLPVEAFRTLGLSNGKALTYMALVSHCSACDAMRTARRRAEMVRTVAASARIIMANVRSRARKRRLVVEVDEAFVERLWEQQDGRCAYTGLPMSLSRQPRDRYSGGGYRKNHPAAPSLDRLDPARGYQPDNVVLCRWEANNLKQDLPLDRFVTLAMLVATHACRPNALCNGEPNGPRPRATYAKSATTIG